MNTIGQRIKTFRKQKNITQTELGCKLNISHSTINRWENDKATPSYEKIKVLSNLLDTEEVYLAFGNNKFEKYKYDKHPIIPPIPKNDKNIIAFQGEMGAYSNLASKNLYPNATLMPCNNFNDAFNAVQDNNATYAVIPIENSLGGRVADIHHLLPESNLHIIGEYYQKIEHCLLGVKGSTIKDIKSVYSHEQALSQCRKRLHNMEIEPVKYADTAGAGKFIAQEKDMKKGAIASKLCAEIYNLAILQENFEDKKGNTTRFIILSNNPLEYKLYGDNVKTSCIFFTRNIPASLYKALGGFATNGIQILKLESYVPMITKSGQAHFYVEFIGSQYDENVKLALDELKFYTTKIRILGSYKKN